MEQVRTIAVKGLEPVSPCHQCGIHLFGITKIKNKECLACKAREDYDRLIDTGAYTHPFMCRGLREVLGIFIPEIQYASDRR